MKKFRTDFVSDIDKADWRVLFDGYADFYGVVMNDEIAIKVWTWLLDPSHVLEGLLTRDSNGLSVGIAHVRTCPRPLGGNDIGFLDDLFVLPEARGSGVAGAIFAALKELAATRGWPTIRWITQHVNTRGRAFYDRYTNGPSGFIVYNWNQN